MVSHDHEMIKITEWMGDIRGNGSDCKWVERNFELLFEAILYGLGYDYSAIDAIEALNLIFGCVIQRDDYRRWLPLLYEALHHANNLNDKTFKTQIWSQLGENFLKFGERDAATSAFATATEHADELETPEDILRARIGTLKTSAIYQRGNFRHIVQEIVELCRQTRNLELRASTYSALALAYSFRHDVSETLGYGQTAYVIWHQLRNGAQKAEIAFTMAEVCRSGSLFSLSRRFTDLAQMSLMDTHYPRQLAVLAYQTGVLYLTEKADFVAAERWFQLALSKFKALPYPYPYLTVAGYQALGIAQSETGQFTEATSNLHEAISHWRKVENWYEMSNVCHAIGYLKAKQGQYKKARRWFNRAYQIAITLSRSSPAVKRLLEKIDEDISKLDANDA